MGGCTFFSASSPVPCQIFSQHLSVEHFPRLTLELTTNPSNIQIYVKGENISIDTQQCQYPRFFVNKFLLVSNCFTGIPWQWTTAGGDTPDRSYLRHSHPGLGPPPRSIPSIMYIHIYAQKIWKICLYLESCNIV